MWEKREYCACLPDPFLKADGTKITAPSEWKEQAAYFKDLAQRYMYGTWPGMPESLSAERKETQEEYGGRALRERIDLLINERYLLKMELIHPTDSKGFAVIVNNASCCPEARCPIEEKVVVEEGYAIAAFEREMIAPDRVMEPWEKAEYPELKCGTVMAWGWCQSIVAGYLESRDDTRELIATGHSRFGKAALCAGIYDERFAIVAPMGSGCGGAGCVRFLGTVDGKRQNDAHCETIGCLMTHFPHWFSEAYAQFGTKQFPYPLGEQVNMFPLDAHILRAACAPRAVFCSEGAEDFWANAYGTQLARDGAQKVFDFLGVSWKNGFHIRPGGHSFCEEDWMALVEFCNMVLERGHRIKHHDTTMRFFDINLYDYAPWA